MKKRKAPAPAPAVPPVVGKGSDISVFVPSLLLCAIPLIEIWRSTRRHWFAASVQDIHTLVRLWLFWGSLLLALVLSLWRWARGAVATHLDGLRRLRRARHVAWLGAAFVGTFALFFFVKYAQYRSFQLPSDSVVTANLCWNISHRFLFLSTELGVKNYFAVHFMPLLAIIAPVLLVWNNLLAVILLNSAALASMPIAAYLLAYRKSGSSLVAFSAFWLVFTSPFLMTISSSSVVLNLYMSVFFLWALVAAETGHWRLACLAFVLMALTIEQACVAFFGLGLYLIVRLGVREKRSWLLGATLCVASALLFYLELKLRWSFPEASRFPTTSWSQFENLGPTPKAALVCALRQPLDTVRALVWPVSRLKPLRRMLLSVGFLPLTQPTLLIPWAINYLPNFLAREGDYHSLPLHYSSYVIGPLWWAATVALVRVSDWLSRRNLTPWLLIYVLLIGAVNLRRQSSVMSPGWSASLFDEIPALADMIPADAGVWTYEYAAPWLGCRPFIKTLPRPDQNSTGLFFSRLFVPDYVLIWRQTEMISQYQARLWTFLAQEGYKKIGETFHFVLLKHPRAPLPLVGGWPPPLDLPPAGPTWITYAKYLHDFTDSSLMVSAWRRGAEAGEAEAQNMLGVVYARGLGLAPNFQEANSWFRRAAEQGDASAEDRLGESYLFGRGVPQSLDEAAKWFRKAAQAGGPQADLPYNHLGFVLLRENNLEEAVHCFQEALRINPKSEMAHIEWGNVLAGQGKLDDALQHYRQALAINPANAGIQHNVDLILGRLRYRSAPPQR